MKHIHFAIRPYRNDEGKVNPKFIYLCIVADDGEIVEKESIRTSAWRYNEDDSQPYWKHVLLSRIKDRLISATKASKGGYIYKKETRFVLDDATYDEWYHWCYFIDDEDAHEYIKRINVSQHTTNWQARCGVIAGWTFYKKLRQHDFCEDTAAMLAYTRGYLAGMESNSPWGEGMEALHCLGLDIEGGSEALCSW